MTNADPEAKGGLQYPARWLVGVENAGGGGSGSLLVRLLADQESPRLQTLET